MLPLVAGDGVKPPNEGELLTFLNPTTTIQARADWQYLIGDYQILQGPTRAEGQKDPLQHCSSPVRKNSLRSCPPNEDRASSVGIFQSFKP